MLGAGAEQVGIEHLLDPVVHAFLEEERIAAGEEICGECGALQLPHLVVAVVHQCEQGLIEALERPAERRFSICRGHLLPCLRIHASADVGQLWPALHLQFRELSAECEPYRPLIGAQCRRLFLRHLHGSVQGIERKQRTVGAGQRHALQGIVGILVDGRAGSHGLLPRHDAGILRRWHHLTATILRDDHQQDVVEHVAEAVVDAESEGGIAPQLQRQMLNGREHDRQFGCAEDAVGAIAVGWHGQGDIEPLASQQCVEQMVGQYLGLTGQRRMIDINGALALRPPCGHGGDARHGREEGGEREVDGVHLVAAHLVGSAERIVAPHGGVHHVRALDMHEHVSVHIFIIAPNKTGVAWRQHGRVVEEDASDIVGPLAEPLAIEERGVADVVEP